MRIPFKVKDLPDTLKKTVKALTRRQKGSIVPIKILTIGSTQWDGGSRDLYTVVELATGRHEPWSDTRPWPENMHVAGKAHIPSGYAIIKHGTFLGKDALPTIYCNEADVPKQIT